MNVLCVGAHPDDIELCCGGFLLRNRGKLDRLDMLTLTCGEASGNPDKRLLECYTAAKLVDGNAIVKNYPDANMILTKDLIDDIEEAIIQNSPDLIFTHIPTDTHHDHRITAEATFEAGRNCPNILCFEDIVTKQFQPHIYYDITEVIEEKIKLAGVFETQKHKYFMQNNAIEGLAKYRAMQCRPQSEAVLMMECYHVHKLTMNDGFQIMKYLQ